MGDSEDKMTQMMSRVNVAGDRGTPVPGAFRERTRAAWHFVKPVMRKTTWWVLLAAAVLMVMWEVDDVWNGTIYGWLGWVRENVLKTFPIVPFGLGMLVYHYVLKAERGGDNDSKAQ